MQSPMSSANVSAKQSLGDRRGWRSYGSWPRDAGHQVPKVCSLQRLAWTARAKKVRVADEEALAVVTRVDKPAGDAVGISAVDLAGAGVEAVHAVRLHADLAVLGVLDLDGRR